jgi:Lrp/AsnC family transcriptional regulator for asnA, asnC and gidA
METLDRKLIEHLEVDARANYRTLAGTLGVNRATVQRRLARLFESGTARQVLLIDPTIAGAPQSLLVGLDVPRAHLTDIFDHLLGLPAVSRVSENRGRFNVIAVAIFRDSHAMGEFVAGSLKNLEHVRACEVFPVFQTRAERRPAREQRALDTLDRKLVAILEKDCRVSDSVLARQAGVSVNTVQRRLAALMEGGFMRILTTVTEGTPGWVRHAGMGIRVRRPYAGKVMNRLARFPEVKYYTCGRYDILGSVICASEDKIYEVVEERIARLEGV